jgi:hypothetical protein
MKSLLSAAVCICFALNVSGQGTLIWNPPTTPITTNGLGGNGPISGAGLKDSDRRDLLKRAQLLLDREAPDLICLPLILCVG